MSNESTKSPSEESKRYSSSEMNSLDVGLELLFQEKYEEATIFFSDLLRENPDDAYSHFGLGCVYSLMGNIKGAIQEWRNSHSIAPLSGYTLYALSWVSYALGDSEEGYTFFTKALDTGIDYEKIRFLFERLPTNIVTKDQVLETPASDKIISIRSIFSSLAQYLIDKRKLLIDFLFLTVFTYIFLFLVCV